MSAWVGAALGLVGGAGASIAVLASPPLNRPTWASRVQPYVPGIRTEQPGSIRTPFPTIERLVGPLLVDQARRLDRLIGGAISVRRRLDRLSDVRTVEQFRVEQVLGAAMGLLSGLAFAAFLALAGRQVPVLAALILMVLGGVGGVLVIDRRLTTQVTERERRIAEELPTTAELLALCVTAGDGPVSALSRVADATSGELSNEIGRTLTEARTGLTVVSALDSMSRRTGVPALARFADGMAVSVERGTPLADVLRAQALDAREAGRRALIESGARREIAMMIPVVFLILPISVVFALFPGFYGLVLTTP